IDALLFATTTPPYGDKLAAALVGAALRLPAELRATDSTGSVRAGLTSLLQGVDVVRGGARHALVAMADARLAAPEAQAERQAGAADRPRAGGVRRRHRERPRRDRRARIAHA